MIARGAITPSRGGCFWPGFSCPLRDAHVQPAPALFAADANVDRGAFFPRHSSSSSFEHEHTIFWRHPSRQATRHKHARCMYAQAHAQASRNECMTAPARGAFAPFTQSSANKESPDEPQHGSRRSTHARTDKRRMKRLAGLRNIQTDAVGSEGPFHSAPPIFAP